MSKNMFLPKQLHVGFNQRNDTYTGKLAYVIYTDDKGVKRKEKSWDGWKDKKIPVMDIDNEPISGFVLNKSAGGNGCSSWNNRRTTARVYDPRGFEIEISIDNLIFILEHTNSYKGKGLEGDFVYSFDGKELVLLPVNCPDYKLSKQYSDILFNKDTIKAKDLVIGHTYSAKDDDYVFLGKYENHDNKNPGKEFYFMAQKYNYIRIFKSISKKFFKDSGEKHPEFDKFFKKLEKESSYSPIDESKSIYEPLTMNDLNKQNHMGRFIKRNDLYESNFYINQKGLITTNYSRITLTKEEFLKMKPLKKKVYLKNGHLHKKIGY